MSGHNHSGLERDEYQDREALLDAISVISRRWPHYSALIEDIKILIWDLEH